MRAQLSGMAAVAVLLVGPAAAQVPKPAGATIVSVPATSHPPVPAGLKVTCLRGPNVLQSSKTCPVVKYQGITTWAYSFIDNRVSMALVSYNAQNQVVRNITKNGTRYVWSMISSVPSKTVLIAGQSDKRITVRWSDLGRPHTRRH